jgi:hypothetical protein
MKQHHRDCSFYKRTGTIAASRSKNNTSCYKNLKKAGH